MPLQTSAIALQTTEDTRAAVANRLGAFTSVDHGRLVACYDDEVNRLFLAPASVFPFGGPGRGKAAVFQGFALLYESDHVAACHVEAMLADGDRASTLAIGQLLQLGIGRIVHIRTGNFYRFCAGKVIEYRGFADTVDIVEQVPGRELDF